MTGGNRPADRLSNGLDAADADLRPLMNAPLSVDDEIRLLRNRHEDNVRTFVTKWVVSGFIAVLAMVVVAYLAAGWFKTSTDAVAGAGDMVLKGYAPIVTLVLGYYFGSSKR